MEWILQPTPPADLDLIPPITGPGLGDAPWPAVIIMSFSFHITCAFSSPSHGSPGFVTK